MKTAAWALVLMLLTSPALAGQDRLIGEIEHEIKMRKLERETYRAVSSRVWTAMKTTALYAEYEDLRVERQELTKKIRGAGRVQREILAIRLKALRGVVKDVRKEMEEICKKFERRIFIKEMLKKLSSKKGDEAVLQNLERAFKRHAI